MKSGDRLVQNALEDGKEKRVPGVMSVGVRGGRNDNDALISCEMEDRNEKCTDIPNHNWISIF